MQSIKEQSLIDSAERIIRKKKTPLDLYKLFDMVCAEKNLTGKNKTVLITQFYTDLITSAKFVYTGDNNWDLKEFQKTELREKDGSFYKEYTVVEDKKGVTPAKPKTRAKRKTKAKVKPVIEKVKVEETSVIEKTVKEEVVIDTKIKGAKLTDTGVEVIGEYEEEVFEEYEDEFDEDKYNEYMDTYEDKYDEK